MMAERMRLEPGSKANRDVKPSPGLRWLVLGKLRLIHAHLADAAEQREEISRWAPAVTEEVPGRTARLAVAKGG